MPVVRISRHRSRACARSWRPSTSTQVGVGGLEQRASLGGQDLDLVAEQGEPGQHLGRGLQGVGQQQQGAHGGSPPRVVGPDRDTALGSGCLRSLGKPDRHIGRIQPVAETNVIRVRYWAAAKAAAGTEPTTCPSTGPITLAELRAAAAALHPGTRLAEVLAACSVLVGDRPVGTADPDDVLHRAGRLGGVPAAVRGRLIPARQVSSAAMRSRCGRRLPQRGRSHQQRRLQQA